MANQRSLDTPGRRDNGDGREEQQLATLRALLFHREQEELAELKRRLAEDQLTAERLSRILPAAVKRATDERPQLSEAMGPMLSEAFRTSVRRNPQALVDAISPIMGPAIRQAISQAISGMIQSLNKTLEYSLSWKSWRWRLEAYRTGKPFAEIVLLHTLLYRTDQAFLIHRETGLLLAHARSTAAGAANADLVSGMLSAIQDFVRDSLGASPDEELQTLQVGDHTVWIESGPQLLLAVVIRGHAPETLRTKLREVLELLHLQFAEELVGFEGDNAAFVSAVPTLEQCLVTAYLGDSAGARRGLGRFKAWPAVAVLTLLLAAASYFWWSWRAERRLGQWTTALELPATASLHYRDRTLLISGAARNDWIERSLHEAHRIPQVDRVDISQLENLDAAWLAFVQRLRQEPGISITDTEVRGGRYALSGLRDPLAADPRQWLDEAGLASEQVQFHWKPFQSLELPLLQKRLQAMLAPPESIELAWEGNRLRLRGKAPAAWLATAHTAAEAMSAWITVDFSAVSNLELARLHQLQTDLESVTVCHVEKRDELRPDQADKLGGVAEMSSQLAQLAAQLRQPLRITIVGYADHDEAPAGSVARLSESRARAVWRLLVRAGAPPAVLAVQGMGDAEAVTTAPRQSLTHRHCCGFRVQLGQN